MKNQIFKIVSIMFGMIFSISVANSCEISTTITALQYSGGYNVKCNGDCNGSITFSFSEVGGYIVSYHWKGPNGFDMISLPSPLENLCAGTYKVMITDADGCTAISSITLTEPVAFTTSSIASSIFIGGYNISCNGKCDGNITYNAVGGTMPYNYLWSNGSTEKNPSNVCAGSYTILVSDANSCTTTNAITLTEPTPMVISNLISPQYPNGYNVSCIGCNDGSISLMVNGGTLLYNYYWTGPNSFTSTAKNPTGLYAGLYIVTVTDLNGCTTTGSITLIETAPLSISNIMANQYAGGYNVSCNGFCNGSITCTPAGGVPPFIFNWTGSNNYSFTGQNPTGLCAGTYHVILTDGKGNTSDAFIAITEPPVLVSNATGTNLTCFQNNSGKVSITQNGGTPGYTYLWNNSSTNADLIGLPIGNYFVRVTDANGCSSIASVMLTQPPTLIANATGTNLNCTGSHDGTVNVIANGGNPGYQYLWNNGSTNANQSGLPAGMYNVTVTDINFCIATSSVSIGTNPFPSPTIFSYYPTTFCSGGYDLLSADMYGIYSGYLWSTSETTNNITVNKSGLYCVTVSSANGCTGVACINIKAFQSPMPVILGNNAICSGMSAVLDAGSYANYIWSTNAFTRSINVNTVGNFQVTVTDMNGCTGTASKTIASMPNPVATIAPVATQCAGLNLNLSGGTNAMYSYYWNGPNSFTSGFQSPIIPNAQSAATGIYNLTVTDLNGCTGSTNRNIKVNVNPVASISPYPSSAPTTFCPGGSVTLQASPPTNVNYAWNFNNAVTRNITVTATGTYTVTVTYNISGNNCSSSASINVLADCVLPTNLSTINIARTTAKATWTGAVCHYDYIIRFKKTSDVSWTSVNFNNVQYTFSGLAANTSYDWQIETECNSGGSSNSGFSSTQNFITLARLANEEPENALTSFTVYPNPASYNLTIVFGSEMEQNCNLRLVDITGKVVINQDFSSVIGDNHYEMNLSNISKGLYVVLLQNGNEVLKAKVIVE